MTRRTARLFAADMHLRGVVALAAMLAVAALVLLSGAHAHQVALLGAPVLIGTIFPPQFYSNKPRPYSLGAQTFTFGGADLRWKLEKFGYLDQLWIHLTGTVTITTAQLVGLWGFPWNFVSAVKLAPPGRMKFSDTADTHDFHVLDVLQRGFGPFSGTGQRVDVDGIDAYTYAPGTSLIAGASAQTDVFPTAVGATQQVNLWVNINMRRSATDARGRIPLHNDKDVILYLTPQQLAEFVSVPANLSGSALTVEVFQVTYDEVPDSPTIAPFDSRWALMVEKFDTVVPATGSQAILLPTGDDRIYTHVIHGLDIAATGQATSGDIDTLDFQVDRIYLVDPTTAAAAYYFQQKRSMPYGVNVPDGLVVYDFDSYADSDGSPLYRSAAAGPQLDPTRQPSLGRWLATKGSKQIRSRLHIPATVAPAGHTTIHTLIRYFLPVGS